jgi:3-oxoadipate enol-lactonase
LVLVHPIGASFRFWDPLLPYLGTTTHVIRYDLRGHGGSDAPPGDYGLNQFADDLLDLADALGMDAFDVCGVSLGGMVGLAAAARVPGRIKNLVVCSSASRVLAPPQGWDGRRDAALSAGMRPLAGPMVERMFSESFRSSGDPMVGLLRSVFENMNPVGYAGACAILRDADLTNQLPKVRANTLVVSGALDPLCPPEKVRALADALPKARYESLECGHFPPVERPEAFAALLLSHCQLEK